jgi:ABC-type uncharacterized transport system substrate-binding protein
MHRGDRMMSKSVRHKGIGAIVLAAALAPSGGLAHPHVFAEARLEVTIKPNGEVDRLQHVWRFDELFSSTVLLEFDADMDLILDDSESAEVASVVTESIAEFGYFQRIDVGEREIGIKPVDDMKVLFQDGQMILFFTAVPEEAVAVTDSPSFGVYDPTFYTAIEFTDEDQMVLEGAPANCSRSMVVPDPDEAIAQNQASLTDAFFNDPTGNDFSKLLATRMAISCK